MSEKPKLDTCFRDVLDLGHDVDLATTAYGTTEGWDSLAHIQLVAALEHEFGIMLDTDEVIAMNDYGVVTGILRDNHGIAL